MARSLAERIVEPRREPSFLGQMWTRWQGSRASRGTEASRSLATVAIGQPSPLLLRLVETPFVLDPEGSVRVPVPRRRR